jgi:hypothetical protein
MNNRPVVVVYFSLFSVSSNALTPQLHVTGTYLGYDNDFNQITGNFDIIGEHGSNIKKFINNIIDIIIADALTKGFEIEPKDLVIPSFDNG